MNKSRIFVYVIIGVVALAMIAAAAQEDDNPRHGNPHVKDPAECRKFCYPPGGNADRPKDVNEEAKGYECQGELCAKASHEDHGGGPPGEGPDEEPCQPHYSCNVHCSEVCCKCLRECI